MATLHESSLEAQTKRILDYKQEVRDRFSTIRYQISLLENEIIEKLDEVLENTDPNEIDSPSRNLTLSWDEEIVKSLSSLCKVEMAPVPTVIDQVWSSAQRGSEIDQIFRPHGLVVDKVTDDIYIADCYNLRIQVFNEKGQHKKSISHADILNPHRILIVKNSLFITDPINKHIYKLNIRSDEIELSEELEYIPGGLDATNNEIYVLNFSQPIIYSYDIDLYKEREIKLNLSKTIVMNDQVHFLDLKFAQNIIYALLESAFYRVILFDFNGNTLSCIIPSSLVSKAFYFCIDTHQNILLSSWEDNQVLVFSKNGQLKSRIGNSVKGEPNSLVHPRGLDLMKSGALVMCDNKNSTCLHCYAYSTI